MVLHHDSDCPMHQMNASTSRGVGSFLKTLHCRNLSRMDGLTMRDGGLSGTVIQLPIVRSVCPEAHCPR